MEEIRGLKDFRHGHDLMAPMCSRVAKFTEDMSNVGVILMIYFFIGGSSQTLPSINFYPFKENKASNMVVQR